MIQRHPKKMILFFNHILSDGLGDIGHLVDIANPMTLQDVGKQLSKSGFDISDKKLNYEPLYLVSCENSKNALNFVIETLLENKILTEIDHWPPQTTLHDYKVNHHSEYIKDLQKKNNHVHLAPYDQKDKKKWHKHVEDYIENNAILKEQLKDTCAIERVSSHAGKVKQLDSLPVMETFIGEHNARNPYSDTKDEDSPANRTMGFANGQHGILLREAKTVTVDDKEKVLSQLHDQSYLRNLLEVKDDKSVITIKQTKDFLTNTLFIPGHLQNKAANAIFINSLSVSQESKKYKDVVFHVNGKVFDKTLLDLDMLAKNGIASIEINTPGKTEVISTGVKAVGRRIRVMCDYRLDNHDYDSLYQIAQVFAGCSGDKTLERVLSNNLIPFYESRPWKFELPLSLKRVASRYTNNQNVLKYIGNFYNFEVSQSNIQQMKALSQQTASFINDPHFVLEWNKVIEGLKKDYNYYKVLPTVLMQGLAYYELCHEIKAGDVKKADNLLTHFKSADIPYLFRESVLKDQQSVAVFLYTKYPELKLSFDEILPATKPLIPELEKLVRKPIALNAAVEPNDSVATLLSDFKNEYMRLRLGSYVPGFFQTDYPATLRNKNLSDVDQLKEIERHSHEASRTAIAWGNISGDSRFKKLGLSLDEKAAIIPTNKS